MSVCNNDFILTFTFSVFCPVCSSWPLGYDDLHESLADTIKDAEAKDKQSPINTAIIKSTSKALARNNSICAKSPLSYSTPCARGLNVCIRQEIQRADHTQIALVYSCSSWSRVGRLLQTIIDLRVWRSVCSSDALARTKRTNLGLCAAARKAIARRSRHRFSTNIIPATDITIIIIATINTMTTMTTMARVATMRRKK